MNSFFFNFFFYVGVGVAVDMRMSALALRDRLKPKSNTHTLVNHLSLSSDPCSVHKTMMIIVFFLALVLYSVVGQEHS